MFVKEELDPLQPTIIFNLHTGNGLVTHRLLEEVGKIGGERTLYLVCMFYNLVCVYVSNSDYFSFVNR